MCIQPSRIDLTRHSFAHLLAQAVQRFVDPQAQLGTGPALDNGFYYDIAFSKWVEFGEKDLKQLTKNVQMVAKEQQTYVRYDCDLEEGYEINTLTWQWLKNELLDKFKVNGETKISYYLNVVPAAVLEHARNVVDGRQDMYAWVSTFFQEKWTISDDQAVVFLDLCAWPHVENTKEDLDPSWVKLEKLAGAYRQADENNAMMTRIYGLCFENKQALKDYQTMMEEAKKRDHRFLGQQLQLFSFDEEVGPGLPLRQPNWTVIVDALEKFAKETEESYGYQRVRSPHIAKEQLYLRSWHLPYYAEDMFPPMELDNEKYYLKAMNCPHHHKIFKAFPKSYRDLPVRYAEYGHCYRYEDSWALFGLMRVRSLCMNDAHIYCTEEQFEEEFGQVIAMYLSYFETFGIEKYQMRLSKHSKEWLWKKYVDNEALWIKTEKQVKDALLKFDVPFVEVEDEAAFYWPKIDVQIWSVIWREFTLATNQLDFAVPERFELSFTDSDWQSKTPICIHRAPLSTHERMVWFLIEHFAWAFPVRLAPTKAIILPVAEVFTDYATSLEADMKAHDLRVSVDTSWDSLSKMVRNAEKLKIPYILIVGQEEVDNQTVSVREYKTKDQSNSGRDEFIEKLVKMRDERSL